MQIHDRVIIVTGGSSGLGHAVACMGLSRGARVVIADLRPPHADSLPGTEGAHWIHVRADVTDEQQASAAVRAALDRFHRLDVLVNAAGVAPAERLHGRQGPHRVDVFRHTLDVNVVGTFNMMRLAIPGFLASAEREPASDSRGVIVNTASIAAYDGQVGQLAYAASKGAIVSMTLPAARELARDRIRVMTVAPGVFETPLLRQLPADVATALAQSVPHPARLGAPQEYAALVQHIIENEYLNGEVIRLDGAIRMAPR